MMLRLPDRFVYDVMRDADPSTYLVNLGFNGISQDRDERTIWVMELPWRSSTDLVAFTGFLVTTRSGPCRQPPIWKNVSSGQGTLTVAAAHQGRPIRYAAADSPAQD